MADLFYGTPQKKGVRDQLKVRETLLGSNNIDSVSRHKVLNQNTPWVMLRSSVNLLSDEDANKLLSSPEKRPDLIGTEENARNLTLTGGQIKGAVGSARAGVDFPYKEQKNAAYSTFQNVGTVPMPGITNVSIKSRGKYGTIKEAEISVEVHSLEHLDEFDKLFFRPGYSALLEWGHSVYMGNDNSIVLSNPSSHCVSDDMMFTPNSFNKIEKEVERLRTTSDYNYDGMMGYIRNFQWSYDQDSQKYNATISLIGKGVLLEGLDFVNTRENIPEEEINSPDLESNTDYTKSAFHYVFSKIGEGVSKTGLDVKRVGKGSTKTLVKEAGGITFSDSIKDYPYYFIEKIASSDFKHPYFAYVPLGFVFDVMNNYNNLYAGEATTTPLVQFELENHEYETFDDHYSLDPTIAVPPVLPSSGRRRRFTLVSVADERLTRSSGIPYIHRDMQDYANQNGGTNKIENIMVSVEYILDCFDKVINQPSEANKSVIDALGNLLVGVQEALGGINDLALFYNESVGTWICADRNKTQVRDDFHILEVSGLKSTLNSIDVSTSITPNISNMIAIAAQGTSGNFTRNVESLLKWNRKAIDRHNPYKDSVKKSEDTSEEEKQKKTDDFETRFADEWYKFNNYKGGFFANSSLHIARSDFTNLRREALSSFLNVYTRKKRAAGEEPAGVIPVSVGLSMWGMSGMQIATAFKVRPGLLPSNYNRFGHIIVSEEHTINNEGWTTQISSNMFTIEGYTQEEKEGAKKLSEEEKDIEEVEDTEDGPTPNADSLRAVLREFGHLEKGNELSNGGDISETLRMRMEGLIIRLNNELPGLQIRITSGNDKFHKNLTYSSAHKSGRAIDFTIHNNATRYNGTQIREEVMKVLTTTPGFLDIKNEYDQPTKYATAGHFHVKV